jgi:CRISPR-associated protein Cas1
MYILPAKSRIPYIFLEKCKIDSQNNQFVINNKYGNCSLPIEQYMCIYLEPGTSITHNAIKIATKYNTNIFIVGEQASIIYSFGKSNWGDSHNIKTQLLYHTNPTLKNKIIKKLLEKRFNEKFPEKRSIEQLRGLEGYKMKEEYQKLSKTFNIPWNGRKSYPFDEIDEINKCITIGNMCLYGIVETAILNLGFLPSIGFLHGEGNKALVYDISDIFKLKTSILTAFHLISNNKSHLEMKHEFNKFLKTNNIIKEIFSTIKQLFDTTI